MTLENTKRDKEHVCLNPFYGKEYDYDRMTKVPATVMKTVLNTTDPLALVAKHIT